MLRKTVVQLRQNETLRQHAFLLREKSLITTRTGSPMLHVTLADCTGTIQGVYFDVPTHIADALAVGRGVEVSGRVGEFRGEPQITIERIAAAELATLADYLPGPRRPLEQMRLEFDELCGSVRQPDLRRLLAAVFDEETGRRFCEAPGAKSNHHACVGGLLEHTLAVVRIVLLACEIYPELDRDLMVTIALFHDLGKVWSYDPVTFDLTERGTLWTHLYMSASRVERAIVGLPGFDEDLGLRVVHALLAHHGTREHGSPAVPMTLEAVVLHYADNLDADARGAIDHLERQEGDGNGFTEWSNMHQARLFRGLPNGNGGGDSQPSLF